MAYILHTLTPMDEMPRMVWIEATGQGDEVKLTVANAIATLGVGFGMADDLDGLATTPGSCVCTRDLWVERSEDPHVWRVTLISAGHLGSMDISAFDFTCAIQRLQFERLNFGASLEPWSAEGKIQDDNPRLQGMAIARSLVFDC